jgi:glycosyltransferase involved in cell wall biosynthesis
MTPTVSVILPVFNRLQYLRPAVESVLAQTLTDWELVIADDGSAAATRAYLETLERRPRTKIVWLAHTGNPSAVRNAALRAASGEYVAFLDSDDAWLPTKLQRQVSALRSRTDCRWCYTGYASIDDSGEVTSQPSPRPWAPWQGAIATQIVTLEALIATASVLVERHLVSQVGGFDEQQAMFEHYDLWLRLALRSNIVLIDEPLTHLRVHKQHYSTPGVASLQSRDRLLDNAARLVRDPHMRSVIRTLRVRTVLDIANAHADTNRITALKTLLHGGRSWWQQLSWWKGAARVSLKVATPRPLLRIYRQRRSRALARTT